MVTIPSTSRLVTKSSRTNLIDTVLSQAGSFGHLF